MKTFETRGPVDAARNYVVKRTIELADFIARVKQGRLLDAPMILRLPILNER